MASITIISTISCIISSAAIAQNVYFQNIGGTSAQSVGFEIHHNAAACYDLISDVYIYDDPNWIEPMMYHSQLATVLVAIWQHDPTGGYSALLPISVKITMVSGRELIFNDIITDLNDFSTFHTTNTICDGVK